MTCALRMLFMCCRRRCPMIQRWTSRRCASERTRSAECLTMMGHLHRMGQEYEELLCYADIKSLT